MIDIIHLLTTVCKIYPTTLSDKIFKSSNILYSLVTVKLRINKYIYIFVVEQFLMVINT